jgi:hypothetical protein
MAHAGLSVKYIIAFFVPIFGGGRVPRLSIAREFHLRACSENANNTASSNDGGHVLHRERGLPIAMLRVPTVKSSTLTEAPPRRSINRQPWRLGRDPALAPPALAADRTSARSFPTVVRSTTIPRGEQGLFDDTWADSLPENCPAATSLNQN